MPHLRSGRAVYPIETINAINLRIGERRSMEMPRQQQDIDEPPLPPPASDNLNTLEDACVPENTGDDGENIEDSSRSTPTPPPAQTAKVRLSPRL